jgi:putative glutamine amidotransferase
MFTPTVPPAIRIAVYGSEVKLTGRGVGLWNAGYSGTIQAAGAEPVFLPPACGGASWEEILAGCQGVVVCGFGNLPLAKMGDAESLCLWCRKRKFPLLAIDSGLLAMNAAYGGLNHSDLAKELPDALQHRHPPEPGLRHAINILPDTLMSTIYGEGEVVVNSEHRQGIQKLAQGFVATGTALDGVVEAVEFNNLNQWFALGVQWQPASPTASGLDIQVFRALIDAAMKVPVRSDKRTPRYALAG